MTIVLYTPTGDPKVYNNVVDAHWGIEYVRFTSEIGEKTHSTLPYLIIENPKTEGNQQCQPKSTT